MKCDCIERVILRNKKKLFQFSRQNGTLILSENVCCKVVVEPFQYFVLWKYICRLLREHVRLRIKSIVYYIANESIKYIFFSMKRERERPGVLIGFLNCILFSLKKATGSGKTIWIEKLRMLTRCTHWIYILNVISFHLIITKRKIVFTLLVRASNRYK